MTEYLRFAVRTRTGMHATNVGLLLTRCSGLPTSRNATNSHSRSTAAVDRRRRASRCAGSDLIARAPGATADELSADATDVELILRAYCAWGEECVAHLLGDFASRSGTDLSSVCSARAIISASSRSSTPARADARHQQHPRLHPAASGGVPRSERSGDRRFSALRRQPGIRHHGVPRHPASASGALHHVVARGDHVPALLDAAGGRAHLLQARRRTTRIGSGSCCGSPCAIACEPVAWAC